MVTWVKCRNRCGADVIFEDQHLMATPDGDVWACHEPTPVMLLGKDPYNHAEAKRVCEALQNQPQRIVITAVDDPLAHVLIDIIGLPKGSNAQLVVEAVKALMADVKPAFLTCPACGVRHIDKGIFTNKPHHTHACQGCGLAWRPMVGATVGVQFLPGFKDEE